MTIDTSQFGQYYYYIAVFSTLIFAIKLVIFNITGADSEVFTDFNSEIDTDISFNFLSIQSILAFFMGFGWMGFAALNQFNLNNLYTLLAAIGVGLIFMFLNAFLMFSIRKLEKIVKKDKTTALDKIGKAYTRFEPNSNGQIEIEINGQLTVTDAISCSNEVINSFEQIKVVKVENDKLYIDRA